MMNVAAVCGEMREKQRAFQSSALKDHRFVVESAQTVTHEGVEAERISY